MVRQTLKHFGFYKEVYSGYSKNHCVAAGNMYLRNTYIAKVEDRCGFPSGAPECDYLQGRTQRGDVTSTNYAAYDSPENQRSLYAHMRRVPDETATPSWKIDIKDNLIDNHWEQTVSLPDPTKRSKVKRIVTLKPGELLELHSNFGITGSIVCTAPGSNAASNIPTLHYYDAQHLPNAIEDQLSCDSTRAIKFAEDLGADQLDTLSTE